MKLPGSGSRPHRPRSVPRPELYRHELSTVARERRVQRRLQLAVLVVDYLCVYKCACASVRASVR